jgi:hypothetical protein
MVIIFFFVFAPELFKNVLGTVRVRYQSGPTVPVPILKRTRQVADPDPTVFISYEG